MEMVAFSDDSAGAVYVPADGRRLGTVLICHERYGLAQHTLDLAQRLSNAGYLAVAPDFFADWEGDKIALAAGDLSVDLDDAVVIKHLGAAINYAIKHLDANPSRVGVVGVCLSGSYSLLASSIYPELSAAVIMYGGAGDDDVSPDRIPSYKEILPKLKAPVLGIWGEKDHVVSVDEVRRMRQLLEDNGVSYEFTLFPSVAHGWLNSTMPGRYRPAEGEAAWSLVLSFLDRAFAGDFDPDRKHWSFTADTAKNYDFSKNVRLA